MSLSFAFAIDDLYRDVVMDPDRWGDDAYAEWLENVAIDADGGRSGDGTVVAPGGADRGEAPDVLVLAGCRPLSRRAVVGDTGRHRCGYTGVAAGPRTCGARPRDESITGRLRGGAAAVPGRQRAPWMEGIDYETVVRRQRRRAKRIESAPWPREFSWWLQWRSCCVVLVVERNDHHDIDHARRRPQRRCPRRPPPPRRPPRRRFPRKLPPSRSIGSLSGSSLPRRATRWCCCSIRPRTRAFRISTSTT